MNTLFNKVLSEYEKCIFQFHLEQTFCQPNIKRIVLDMGMCYEDCNCDSQDCSTPGFPVLHYLLEFAQTRVHWVGDAIQPSNPLLSLSPPALNFPQHQGFSSESGLHISWPKHWGFSFSISPSNECSGLISFRTDWFDLAVQGTLRSLLQYHSSKASILQHSAFFIVQLSQPYMTTGKTIVTKKTW